MADAEGVVIRSRCVSGSPRNAAMGAQSGHAFTPSGEHLVGIGLVADVPDQAVVRRIEYVVQGDGQFDRTEIGGRWPRSWKPIRRGSCAIPRQAAAAVCDPTGGDLRRRLNGVEKRISDHFVRVVRRESWQPGIPWTGSRLKLAVVMKSVSSIRRRLRSPNGWPAPRVASVRNVQRKIRVRGRVPSG